MDDGDCDQSSRTVLFALLASDVGGSPYKRCKPLDCGPYPSVPNGVAVSTNTSLGNNILITCNAGYIKFGQGAAEPKCLVVRFPAFRGSFISALPLHHAIARC